MSVTITLPDDIGDRLLEKPAEAGAAVHRELALVLYAAGHLPPGRAALLAEMNRWDFEKLLMERQVPFPWTAGTVEEEFRHARGHL